MQRRLFALTAIALGSVFAAPAMAQNKPVIGVSVPAATHGWTGGVV